MLERELKENCIFCQILSGNSPASLIYRDEDVAAFLDIQPINPGHSLVVPIEHSVHLENVTPEIGSKMFRLAQKVASAIRKSGVRCEGINFFLADGEEAGQEVWHTHLHIFPRFSGDGFGLRESHSTRPPRKELDRVAQLILRKFRQVTNG